VDVNEIVIKNRTKLKRHIEHFHSEAGTYSTAIQERIMSLDRPDTQILVSTHQPNLFAYSGVLKKIVLLQNLKRADFAASTRNNKPVDMFLIIDHDFIDEVWMRVAQLPSFRHVSGILSLRLPIRDPERWKMVRNVPLPNRSVILNWRKLIISWIRANSSLNQREDAMKNFKEFWLHVESAYSRAKSFSDFNSYLLSIIVNGIWNYDTLFVRLSDICESFEDGFRFLSSNFNIYSKTLEQIEQKLWQHGIDTGISSKAYLQSPFWIRCTCGGKAASKLITNGECSKLNGSCVSCMKDLQVDLGNSSSMKHGSKYADILPKAIPIPILLSRDLGILCYASGTGALGYMIDAYAISNRLKVDWPLVVIWPASDIYHGIAQREAIQHFTGKLVDIDAHLQELAINISGYKARIQELLLRRRELAASNHHLDEVLQELFFMKQEQRKHRGELEIIKRIQNIMKLSPCMIDYVVNFGLVKIEVLWTKNLIANDNLASPVRLPSMMD
jgi:hypothetical protein